MQDDSTDGQRQSWPALSPVSQMVDLTIIRARSPGTRAVSSTSLSEDRGLRTQFHKLLQQFYPRMHALVLEEKLFELKLL